MDKKIIYATLLYIFASALDISTTYYNINFLGYRELNPHTTYIIYIYDYPLWIWFLRDLTVWVLIVFTAVGMKKLIEWIGKRIGNPGFSSRSRHYHIIMWLPAITRLVPGIHNLLLAVYGIEVIRVFLPT